MWYCNKCKAHVQATKSMEIFSVPRVMIVSLKRFKQSKSTSRYYIMGGGGNKKLDTKVDFPLTGLDMSPFVLSATQKKKPLVYDCFAVSNHYGSVGGGHYTAYAQNFATKKWYEFDDSRVMPLAETKEVVSSAAYNLFYRLRDHVEDLEHLDFESIR
jgi:ubiquitin carboxyl-terminal hydrolase 4/11